MLRYTEVEWLPREKHSSLLGQFLNYKENKCCEAPGTILQYLIFFVTYERAQNAIVTLHRAGMACQLKTLQLTGPILKLRRK